MVLFVSVLTNQSEFLIFWAILPAIWVYGFFDAVQQLNRKQRGEELIDRSVLEDFEMRREEGKKSKSIANILSIFPGAGTSLFGVTTKRDPVDGGVPFLYLYSRCFTIGYFSVFNSDYLVL